MSVDEIGGQGRLCSPGAKSVVTTGMLGVTNTSHFKLLFAVLKSGISDPGSTCRVGDDTANKLPAACERKERRDVRFLFLVMSSSNQIVTDVRTASSKLLGRRGDTRFRPTANRICANVRREFRRTSPS